MSGPNITTYELTSSLVDHLRRQSKPPMVFTEIAIDGSWGSRGRLDVVTFAASNGYKTNLLRGYEIKVSRADLFRDLDVDKWRQYLGYLVSFTFAIPAGLARLDEIPADAGVMVLGDGGRWQTVRRPTRLKSKPLEVHVLARLLRRAEEQVRHAEVMAARCAHCDKRTRAERLADQQDRMLLFEVQSKRIQNAVRDVLAREGGLETRERDLASLHEALQGAPEVLAQVTELLRLSERAVGSRTYRGSHNLAREQLTSALEAAERTRAAHRDIAEEGA
jgi:hypothetical protein